MIPCNVVLSLLFEKYFFQSQAAPKNAKHIVMSQMDNFESLENELASTSLILYDDNEKNQFFAHNIKSIAQSQTKTGPNASFKMTKEVLNDILD